MGTLTQSPGEIATFSLDHYEHLVNCGAFAPPYSIAVELMRGMIVEKGTGRPARFTLDHYEYMVAVGAFDPPFDIPVELLEGEIVMMSPIGESHSQAIIALSEWSYEVVDRKRFVIRVQMSIRIPATQAEPEPDFVWARRQGPRDKPPEPDRVALLVEVAESSLEYDRTVKLSNYALAGISDYWIVNLIDEQIEIYRKPAGNTYQEQSVYRGDAAIHPLAFPAATLQPSRIFD
jgi:Uma2 family endonuclease